MSEEEIYYKCPKCGEIAPNPRAKYRGRADGKIKCDFCDLLINPEPFEFENIEKEMEYWDNVDTTEFWDRLPEADDIEFVKEETQQ